MVFEQFFERVERQELESISKKELWYRIKTGSAPEEYINHLPREKIPKPLLQRWKNRRRIQALVEKKGIADYASNPLFDSPGEIQRQLNQLRYDHNFDDFSDQCLSASLALKKGQADCLEGALIAAYIMQLRGYPPQLLAFKGWEAGHLLYFFKNKGKYYSLKKTRGYVSDSLCGQETLEALAQHHYRKIEKELDFSMDEWGICDLRKLSLNWWEGSTASGYVEGIHRKIDRKVRFREIKCPWESNEA